MDKDLLEITVNLAYAGMSAHTRAQQNPVEMVSNRYAFNCYMIAKRILELVNADVQFNKKENNNE